MVMKIEMDKIHMWRKKTASVILIWILVASSVFVLFPLAEPKAEALLYHLNTTNAEDQDRGDGFDYNGDTVGDNKITWHASDNPHIVTNTFFVLDNYILELEAGVLVQIDPDYTIQVGQTTGGAFYANGTSGNPVMMEPNSSFPWGGISILVGSYGFISYSQIDQAVAIWSDDSTLDIENSEITDMNWYGVYGTTSSTVTVTNTLISGSQLAAIQLSSSTGLVSNCDIYGYNATLGAAGGHGIVVTGLSPFVTISDNNNIIGGSGGPGSGAGGGDGGFAVFDSNYDGQLNVVNNQIIQGGDGGNSMMPGNAAGDGGIGVHVVPISDSAPMPAVNISGNTLIQGGKGGDNNGATDGSSGNGATAIRITDNPPGSSGMALVSSNTDIIGGAGGINNADYATSGWVAGDGGEGIYITNVKKPASVIVNQNPNIEGGAGGNNTGQGMGLTPAGEGGNGILLYNSTDVMIQQSTTIGGHGGNNAPTGINARGGDGGEGVFLYYPNTAFSSAATITLCTLTGGEGGDDWVGFAGPGQGGPGSGGSGIYSSQSSGICSSSTIVGGKGGDNFGPLSFGGRGGYGTAFSDSLAWSVSGGTITGGKGGSNFEPSSGGGQGGRGAYVFGSNNAAFSMVTNIVGGDGGDSDVGTWGPGSAALESVYLVSSDDISFLRNDIRTGIGGLNASSGDFGTNDSTGIFSSNLGGSNTILGNDITTNNIGGNTYGIYLGLAIAGTASVEGNDIYTNNVGIYVLNSDGATIGTGNNIYDNNFGVYFKNSDAIMGTNNIISDNNYGIFCNASSPTITGDKIINSSSIGMLFTAGSNAVVEDCIIEKSNDWNVYSRAGVGSGSSPKFYNSTLITKSGAGEFYQKEDSHPWLLNTTFDKTKTSFGDALSNITVNWYMHVNVIDTSYADVPGATVWINDTYGTNLFMLTTDAQGMASWNVITEYIENTTGYEYYHTPHNASAIEGGRFGFSEPTMTKSRVVVVMLDGISVDIILKKGWNMISIPVDQPSSLVTDVFSAISGQYDAVQWYDVLDSADNWKHYHTSKPASFNDLSDVFKTMGVWIFMDSYDILSIAGPIPVPGTTDIDLKTGWNFVGYPSISTKVAGNASGEAFEFVSGTGSIDMVQYFNAADSGDPWKEWDPGSMSPDDLTDIMAGMGLWIHTTGDCTWSVGW
jgi:hypothetical protein